MLRVRLCSGSGCAPAALRLRLCSGCAPAPAVLQLYCNCAPGSSPPLRGRPHLLTSLDAIGLLRGPQRVPGLTSLEPIPLEPSSPNFFPNERSGGELTPLATSFSNLGASASSSVAPTRLSVAGGPLNPCGLFLSQTLGVDHHFGCHDMDS